MKALPEPLWAPSSCTLPTVQQPLRQQEFDDLCADAAIGVERVNPTIARLTLRAEPGIAARAAALAASEVGCCSFFTFTLTIGHDVLALDVSVPSDRSDVLDALAGRAGATTSTRTV